MGNNTVAVLYNDYSDQFENSGAIGKRIAYAMNNWSSQTRDGYFGAGRVISRDSSSGYQVVVVHGNTGELIQDANSLPDIVLQRLAECLIRNGWRAQRPWRRRRRLRPNDDRPIEARGDQVT